MPSRNTETKAKGSDSHPNSESRARQFYKKPTASASSSINVSISKKTSKKKLKGKSQTPKKPVSSPSIVERRAKVKFYQKQNHANVSWYATKECTKQHLEYVLKKYPVNKLIDSFCILETRSKPVSSDGKKQNKGQKQTQRLQDSPETHQTDLIKAQLSKCAVDKIWLFAAKRAEQLLKLAAENTIRRRAQTATVLDLCQAYDDLNKMSNQSSCL